MRSWRERLLAMAMAVAFAEEGEWETAKSLLTERDPRRRKVGLDDKPRPRLAARKTAYRV